MANARQFMAARTAAWAKSGGDYTFVNAVFIENTRYDNKAGFVIPIVPLSGTKVVIDVMPFEGSHYGIMLINNQNKTSDSWNYTWCLLQIGPEGYSGGENTSGGLSCIPRYINWGERTEIVANYGTDRNDEYIGLAAWIDNRSKNANWYGVKVYDPNNTLICDLRPCIRNSDGKVGFLDVVGEYGFITAKNKNIEYAAIT